MSDLHPNTNPRGADGPAGAVGDTSIQKIDGTHSPEGEMGQTYLASGKRVAMRLWRNEEPTDDKAMRAREYETVGYVISGRATLVLHGQNIDLNPGDSWVVPEGVPHSYTVHETFTAVEATSPPARIKGRDEPIE